MEAKSQLRRLLAAVNGTLLCTGLFLEICPRADTECRLGQLTGTPTDFAAFNIPFP